MILCDTGPLVAAFNAADRDHVLEAPERKWRPLRAGAGSPTTSRAATRCCWPPPTCRPLNSPCGARDELPALGLVARGDLVELADGNVAGPGDLIVASKNSRITAGPWVGVWRTAMCCVSTGGRR